MPRNETNPSHLVDDEEENGELEECAYVDVQVETPLTRLAPSLHLHGFAACDVGAGRSCGALQLLQQRLHGRGELPSRCAFAEELQHGACYTRRHPAIHARPCQVAHGVERGCRARGWMADNQPWMRSACQQTDTSAVHRGPLPAHAQIIHHVHTWPALREAPNLRAVVVVVVGLR